MATPGGQGALGFVQFTNRPLGENGSENAAEHLCESAQKHWEPFSSDHISTKVLFNHTGNFLLGFRNINAFFPHFHSNQIKGNSTEHIHGPQLNLYLAS